MTCSLFAEDTRDQAVVSSAERAQFHVESYVDLRIILALNVRTCLSPALVAEFDAEGDLTLDEAKRDKDLTPIHELLNKWQHLAYAELKEPGVHNRLMAKAEQILRSGPHPGGVPIEEVRARLARRLGR